MNNILTVICVSLCVLNIFFSAGLEAQCLFLVSSLSVAVWVAGLYDSLLFHPGKEKNELGNREWISLENPYKPLILGAREMAHRYCLSRRLQFCS